MNFMTVLNSSFLTLTSTFLQAINRLSKGCLSTDVNNLMSQRLDSTLKNKISEDFKNNIKQIQLEMNQLQDDLVCYKTENDESRERLKEIEERHIPINVRSK